MKICGCIAWVSLLLAQHAAEPTARRDYLVADYLPLKCILRMHGISDCHFSNNASGVNCTSAKHESSLEKSYGLCPPQQDTA